MTRVPNLITGLGLLLGLAGAILASTALLAVSLGCDVADGAIARKLQLESTFGALFDWWSDIAIGNAIVIALIAGAQPIAATIGIGAMAVCQFTSNLVGARSSGRALVTAIAALAWVTP